MPPLNQQLPKTNTIYDMHTFVGTKVYAYLGASKCMHVVYSVGFRAAYLMYVC